MQQLIQYITLLKRSSILDTLKILQDMEHDNRVFQYNYDINTIILDGNWLIDFIKTHTEDELTNIMRSLHNLFGAGYLKLIYKDITPDNFAWDDTYQKYLSITWRIPV